MSGDWLIYFEKTGSMKRDLLSVLLIGSLGLNCATSVPMSDDTVVASEISVVAGRDPVLFVGRNPEEGQWIMLTDERATRQTVVFALFQDLLAMDSTLSEVRDLRIGWQATRLAKESPWVKGPFSMTSQAVGQRVAQEQAPRRSGEAGPGRPTHYFISVSERNDSSSQGWRTSVEEKSVSTWLVEGSENIVETLRWSGSMAPAVRASLDSLVQRCGLDTIKGLYSNPIGSGGKKFFVSIWDPKGEHSTSTVLKNCWVPSLYELCSFINSLLPERYAMDLAISGRPQRRENE